MFLFYCKFSARLAFCHTIKTRKNNSSWASHAREVARIISVKCAQVFVIKCNIMH